MIASRATADDFEDAGAALNLAMFRMVFFGYLAWFAATAYDWTWFASLPDALRTPPPLAGWYAALPFSPAGVRACQIALIITALAAAIGWQTRFMTGATAVLSLLVLGVPQMYLKIDHYHHLVWFAAILAASPCGDVLSVDAWRERRPRPARALAYALPLRYIWTLIGLIYFFPGLAKARALPMWVHPDNLKFQLYAKWAELDNFAPLLPIDQWPFVLSLAAAATIAFELSFLWLVLHHQTRLYAAAGGLLFHLMTWQMMGISFVVLQVCYVAFVPWDRVFRWSAGLRPANAALWPIKAAGLTVVALAATAGVIGLNSWPISVYPTFNAVATPTIVRLDVVARDSSGQTVPISAATLNSVRAKFKEGRFTRLEQLLIQLPHDTARARLSESTLGILQAADPGLLRATSIEISQTTRAITGPPR
jgi:hypothetical protein